MRIAVVASVIALGALALAGQAAAAARVSLLPASGAAGSRVALSGSGFGSSEPVKIGAGKAELARVRASSRGAFSATVTIPAGVSGSVELVSRGRTRQVRNVFRVTAASDEGEVALAGGARLRFSPRSAYAGGAVQLSGVRFPRRAAGRAYFRGGASVAVRVSRRGRFALPLSVPAVSPGPHAVGVRVGRSRFTLSVTVLPDPTIAAAGDIACGADSSSASCKQGVTSDLLLQLNPTAVLALGDVQYEKGQYDNFLHFYDPSWGRLKAITYPAVGNHEYGTPGASGYFDYFDGVSQPTGRAGDRGKGFYAFDMGAWRLYALNSNCGRTSAPGCGEGSEQLGWLRADLETHPHRCSLAFMHHPLFTSDTRDFDSPAFRAKLRPLWQAFYDHGGDVVLVGHSHFYERYAPQDPLGRRDDSRGIRQFIVGTGGRNVYEPGTPLEQNSEVHNGKTFGVIDMALHASSYDWRFVPEPGKTFTDTGSQGCH